MRCRTKHRGKENVVRTQSKHRHCTRSAMHRACVSLLRVTVRYWLAFQLPDTLPVESSNGGWLGEQETRNVSPLPLCDIPSDFCFFTGPWTLTQSSLHMLRRGAALCRLLRPVLLLVLFPRPRGPVVGVPGLCWMWHGVPFARQRHPIVGVLGMCWLLPGSFDRFCCPRTSVHRPSIACLALFLCA